MSISKLKQCKIKLKKSMNKKSHKKYQQGDEIEKNLDYRFNDKIKIL